MSDTTELFFLRRKIKEMENAKIVEIMSGPEVKELLDWLDQRTLAEIKQWKIEFESTKG